MKKGIKILSLVTALVLSLLLVAGCASSGKETSGDESVGKRFTMTVGIPVDENDAEWSDWSGVISSWKEDFSTYSNIDLKFTKIPTDEKELKSFMKKVDSGKIACFFTNREDFINELAEKDKIKKVPDIRAAYNTVMEKTSDAVFTISEESDLDNYMIPTYGYFQGLYYNRALLKSLTLENPTTWENLMADIAALKAQGITPIAAGFKDEGLQYFIDELVLSEGGTAEHSYAPTFGIMASWERTLNDIKTLETAGTFTSDCYNVSFDDALQSFLDGKAAMIVAPSDAFGGKLSLEDVKVVGFPNTPTGKRETGAFIGRMTSGVYVSSAFFNKPDTRYPEAIVELLGTDYFGSSDFYDLFKTEGTLCADVQYYDSTTGTKMDEALKSLLTNATAADWPMKEHLQTFDNMVQCFRNALTGADAATMLQEATDAEIAAQAAVQKK